MGTGTSGVLCQAAARMQKWALWLSTVTGKGLQFQAANLQREVQGRGVALGCSVHRGRLVALSGLHILGEGWLLVVFHRGTGVGGVGCVRVWGGVNVVLNEGIHSSLVALVGQESQHTLQGETQGVGRARGPQSSPKTPELPSPAHLPRKRWRRS